MGRYGKILVMRGIFTLSRIKLLILIAIFTVGLVSCGAPKNSATVTGHTGSAIKPVEEKTEDAIEETDVKDKDLYIVENLDMTEESIALYSISEAKQYRYNYTMTTRFLDKFGENSTWAEFTIGSVVTIGDFLPSSGALAEIQKSDNVWMFDDISKYSIDTDNNLISINGSNYKLTSSTKFYSDTEKILPSNIGADDVITVIGQEKDVISIAVTTGHGYIHLTNTSLFNDSMIFIGNKIVSMVKGDEIIEVPEGSYKITVANNGWGGSDEYTVTRNATTEVNLEDLKGEGPSYCLITFLVTVPDTYVYIDGEEIDVTEPQYVQYGSHRLQVKCEGYTSWNKTLVVNSESATITLAMESEDGTTYNEPISQEENVEEGEGEELEEEAEEEEESGAEVETAGSSIKDDYDYEVDYLSTISDLLSNITQ